MKRHVSLSYAGPRRQFTEACELLYDSNLADSQVNRAIYEAWQGFMSIERDIPRVLCLFDKHLVTSTPDLPPGISQVEVTKQPPERQGGLILVHGIASGNAAGVFDLETPAFRYDGAPNKGILVFAPQVQFI